MHGEPLRSQVTITNPQGFHLRPQSAFAQLASQFQSQILIFLKEEEKIDGKSPWGLLGLSTGQGSVLTLEVSGPDQDEALPILVEFFSNLAKYDTDTESESEETP